MGGSGNYRQVIMNDFMTILCFNHSKTKQMLLQKADKYNKDNSFIIMGKIWKLEPFTIALYCCCSIVASEHSSSYFLMEIVFVCSDIHGDSRRGGVEIGALRFISGPQSGFCLASWCAAWTWRLQVHSWMQPPTTTTKHQLSAGQLSPITADNS